MNTNPDHPTLTTNAHPALTTNSHPSTRTYQHSPSTLTHSMTQQNNELLDMDQDHSAEPDSNSATITTIDYPPQSI
jgi:hypothetical protein